MSPCSKSVAPDSLSLDQGVVCCFAKKGGHRRGSRLSYGTPRSIGEGRVRRTLSPSFDMLAPRVKEAKKKKEKFAPAREGGVRRGM